MYFRTLNPRMAGAVAAGALLAGCGGGTPSAGAIADTHSIAAIDSVGIPPVPHGTLGKSWIRPDAARQWLLYVSDGENGAVDIYSFRKERGKLVGQITGLSFPYGQCVDKNGNVYVVDNDTSRIYEYAHGGTTPIATAKDKFGKPDGCAVDRTSGNVAISNFSGSSSSDAGGLDIFSGGLSGKQTYYTNPNLYRVFPGAYGVTGGFFAQGIDYSGVSNFVELLPGQKQFTMLTGLTIAFPGSVQWDGSWLDVTDQNYGYGYTTMIYRVSVTGSSVTVVHSSHLIDDCYPNYDWMVAIQPFVTGGSKDNVVAAGNLNCPNRENFYKYTTGGTPTWSLPSKIAPAAPYGQTISGPSRN
ncbi:MAG TPA: hypothetical protein VN909_01245 [Candidatus Dormibacteraeota bacterium]|nr:hypothetical protein [Candidatus Dormibacteraeota bacterium]